MGNVLLPQELYEFVKKKIETGEFSSLPMCSRRDDLPPRRAGQITAGRFL
jgi:hypothetical protein